MIDLSLIRPALVIALHAPKGTGKGTVARGLRDKVFNQQRPSLHLDSFALPLYRACSALTNLSVEQLQDETVKEVLWTIDTAPTQSLVGWSPRRLLEFLGTEVVREQLGVNHWVELMKSRLAQRLTGLTVIDDLRFPNETLVADAVIELRREGKEYDDGHVSRQRLPGSYITETIWLKPRAEIDWAWMAEHLIVTAQRAREQKS
jgi:hypothetical protein